MANGLNLKEALFIGCLQPELNALISHDSDCLFSWINLPDVTLEHACLI